jgi:hypothetical protein
MLVAARGTYDLHLRASSPAIGRGVVVTSPSYDVDGTLRPSSGKWDIGAYQASSGTATSKVNIREASRISGKVTFIGPCGAAWRPRPPWEQFFLAGPTL